MEQNDKKQSLTTSQQGSAVDTVSVSLVNDVRKIIEEGRQAAYGALNTAMLHTFWNVGRRLVEEEQHGNSRAGYGEFLARNVADKLQSEYGHTYSYRNICYFRQFYQYFRNLEIVNSRVHNLTWTHFRHLLRVDDEKARLWYMNEAANQLWSTRELERNINTQYYFRLLANQKDKTLEVVDIHAGEPTLPEKDGFIKNPVVAEFLGLKPDRDIPERNLEDAIIHHIEKFLMELGKGYALVDRQKHIPSQIHALYAN